MIMGKQHRLVFGDSLIIEESQDMARFRELFSSE